MAVHNIQFCVVDRRIVRAYQAFGLPNHGLLSVVLLLRNHALLVKVGIPLQVSLGILKVRLILIFRGLCLAERDFERPGIDKREFLPLAYLLPFTEVHLHQLPVNAAVYGHGIEGLNVP
jgi:hypothetical protein